MSEDFSKATPRPWHVEPAIPDRGLAFLHGPGEWYAIKHDIHIYDANCNQVAIAYVNFPGDEAAWDDARHRARLIVAAVNAYRESSEADVERLACKWAQQFVDACPELPHDSAHIITELLLDFRAAIAAIQGERK